MPRNSSTDGTHAVPQNVAAKAVDGDEVGAQLSRAIRESMGGRAGARISGDPIQFIKRGEVGPSFCSP
jgi:hypothetical protein